MEQLVKKTYNNRISAIILGGFISTYFLQAYYKLPTLVSYDHDIVRLASKIIALAEQYNVSIHVPRDVLIKDPDGATKPVMVVDIPPNANIIDIGPQTIAFYETIIPQAKTIFVNGTMGKYEDEDARLGTNKILRAITQTNAYKVIGGGDAVAALNMFNLSSKFDFVSTGGGATLAFLSSESYGQLPALKAFY